MVWQRTALIGIGFALGMDVPARTQPQPPPRVVHIVAERFSFTPSEITVDEGTTLELRITSDDTDHGFRLSGAGAGEVDVEIPKRGRGERRVVIEARTPGRYTFECSRICGAGHSFMRGTLRVVPRTTGPAAGGLTRGGA